MALEWGIRDCKDWEEIAPSAESEEGPRTEALIWATMPIGITKITKNSVDEVILRLRVWERLLGRTLLCYPREDGESEVDYRVRARYKREWVERRIGLWTNATPMTRKQFYQACMERLEREAEISLRYDREKAA